MPELRGAEARAGDEASRAVIRRTGSQQAEPRGGVHAQPIEQVLERCGGDPTRGLTSVEAQKRLSELGRNELPKQPKASALARILSQFANPIVLTLLVAAVIALVNGASRHDEPLLVRFGDAIAIFLIVFLNAILGFYQERRAEQALDALEKMQSAQARVRRDEKLVSIDAAEVVVGDLIELEAGDAVPADARLLQTIDLAVEESSLTGESMPAGKDARAALALDAPLGDRATMLFVGTSIVRGKGRAIVVATGVHTELGKLSVLIHRAGDRTTPLEDKLSHFGKRILWACLALSALLFLRGMIKGDRPLHELLLEAVSLAVAAIPEGLPAITTITLALGMQRMAKRGAIIRKLAAVETLGAATVICSDKTGTLTQNEMTVREIFTGDERFDVSGTGYAPEGDIVHAGRGEKIGAAAEPLSQLLATAALCNNATLDQDADGKWKITGDPTEAALLTLASKGGVPKESVLPGHRVLKEVPFDSDRKRMTIVTLDARGREVIHTKGSADVLLPLCSKMATASGVVPLEEDERARILRESERMSGEALRVLALAKRDLDHGEEAAAEPGHEDHHGADLEKRLTFLGLVGMIDPPRVGVKEAIRSCAEAQVSAVMITGDHKLTAIAIARELGLWSGGNGNEQAGDDGGAIALSGSELESMTDDDLVAKIDRVRVFARVTAEQKLRIVRLFKRAGHIVAMTGDGVNDAPALREAHIGVAMGKDGTDVARQAADMVLADDNFATIVDAVREGRAIWRNIQKFIFFLLSSNAGLLVTVFAASFIPGLPPLTPLMILWINLVTNGLPALALGVDPPDPTQMMEPPRKAQSGLLGTRDYSAILGVGVWMGGTALACYLWPWKSGDADGSVLHHARAIAFSLLALSPLFHAFNCRSPVSSIFAMRPLLSKPLLAGVVLSGAIHLVAILVPSLRPVFRTFQMSIYEWEVMLLLSASIIPTIEALKFFQRLFSPNDKPPIVRRDPATSG